ncbi:sugar transferase [Wansuia hejianensis]|uniref:Sugar transferase n=1 Tax=Wansuia hejianensis TaxID=2763667 RepID=A0A926EYZ0_9FIRM|nr:sugar transferase [Wansuia hejianensis]MBC8590181.1 sugar transferase [Wansuia hejianensis]
MYKYVKRFLDICLSILILIPLFFVFIIVGIAIKLDDRGPIFYLSDRLGKDGRTFKMFKFRSMKVNAEDIRNKDGSTYNSPTDPRVTKVGKFLRETSIDELPQFINVLKGDMSLIGPRPGLPDMFPNYEEDEKGKVLVRPGITGYTQAFYRNTISAREKRLKDAWYAHNVSFSLDLKIFFKTISIVLKREGIYTNDTKDIELNKEKK